MAESAWAPTLSVRRAPFALRIVDRAQGRAAIVYRRRADAQGRDRLQRVGAIGPLAWTAGLPLVRDGVAAGERNVAQPAGRRAVALSAGKFHALDAEWGARLALYALVSAGLRDAERLILAAGHLRSAHADEAAWWLGLLTRDDNHRALRALRILVEAVD